MTKKKTTHYLWLTTRAPVDFVAQQRSIAAVTLQSQAVAVVAAAAVDFPVEPQRPHSMWMPRQQQQPLPQVCYSGTTYVVAGMNAVAAAGQYWQLQQVVRQPEPAHRHCSTSQPPGYCCHLPLALILKWQLQLLSLWDSNFPAVLHCSVTCCAAAMISVAGSDFVFVAGHSFR